MINMCVHQYHGGPCHIMAFDTPCHVALRACAMYLSQCSNTRHSLVLVFTKSMSSTRFGCFNIFAAVASFMDSFRACTQTGHLVNSVEFAGRQYNSARWRTSSSSCGNSFTTTCLPLVLSMQRTTLLPSCPCFRTCTTSYFCW